VPGPGQRSLSLRLRPQDQTVLRPAARALEDHLAWAHIAALAHDLVGLSEQGSRSSGRASSTYQRATSPSTSSSRSSSPPNCNDCAMPSPRTIQPRLGRAPRGDRPSRQPATTRPPRRRDPPPPRSAPPHPHTGRLRHLSPQHPIPTLLAASVTHAMAVAVGASRTPGGLRIAA
jgi:hypothetical protein